MDQLCSHPGCINHASRNTFPLCYEHLDNDIYYENSSTVSEAEPSFKSAANHQCFALMCTNRALKSAHGLCMECYTFLRENRQNEQETVQTVSCQVNRQESTLGRNKLVTIILSLSSVNICTLIRSIN